MSVRPEMPHGYRTARCILYRDPGHRVHDSGAGTASKDRVADREYLLAVHSSFWGQRRKRWGLPGGRIERGESPADAVLRELAEELTVEVPSLIEIGPFPYKKSLHMVYAAVAQQPIRYFDETELLEIGWFSEADVAALLIEDALHASYELDAIRALSQKLGG